ncbi:MAG: helix-turn-helix domain-containing protein [Chitinophagaceae bacterium]|nr:MAG: helix-turn-helix domain-containing protein [Chitinophagaceae bacterium]
MDIFVQTFCAVTYFAQNLKHLRKRSARTQEQLGQEVRLGRTTIANYESGLSGPTDPEVLVRLSHLFGVSIDELLTRDLAQAFAPAAAAPAGPPPGGDVVAHTLTRAPFVAREEAARYLQQGAEPGYLEGLPAYGLPGLRSDEYRVFEVTDPALAPRFEPGDRVLCRRAPAGEPPREGAVYLLVSPVHGLLLRRLRSDGAGRWLLGPSPGGPVTLAASEVRELWQAEWVLSARLDPPLEDMNRRIADLEEQLSALSRRLT